MTALKESWDSRGYWTLDCQDCGWSTIAISRGILAFATDAHLATCPSDTECHCGETVAYGYDGDPTHHRGMCVHCDPIRCDAYPGECKR